MSFKKFRPAPDKIRHFYAGILMGLVLQAAALWFMPERTGLAIWLVLGIVIVISYGFELFSKITGLGHYDIIDAVASAIGGIVGMAAAYFLFYLYF